MKLTWFGARTLRLHIGGHVVVWGPAPSPGLAMAELVSGADRVVAADAALPPADGAAWRPRRAVAALADAAPLPDIAVLGLGPDLAVVEVPGEAPLLLAGGAVPALGRWSREAVVVAFSSRAAASVLAVEPRLVVLALEAAAVDAVFEDLRGRLGDTGLLALELALAVEI